MFPDVKHASSASDCRKSVFSKENNQIFYSLASIPSNVTLQGFGKYRIDKCFARNNWRDHHAKLMFTKIAYSDTALFHYLYQKISHLIFFSSTLHPKILPPISNMHLSINNHRSSEMSHCAFVQCFLFTAFSNLDWNLV